VTDTGRALRFPPFKFDDGSSPFSEPKHIELHFRYVVALSKCVPTEI